MRSESVPLVQSGRSKAVIVLAADLAAPATAAVRDLVDTIARMSGAALPVVGDYGTPSGGPQIHIGATRFCVRNRIQPASLPVNGYRIVTLNDKLVITGTHAIGTSHGVYDVLTRELGVMWGMPDPLFADIPAWSDVEIRAQDRTETPAFGFRVFSGTERNWERRQKIDPAGPVLPYYGHGHNLFNILPPSKYADHPEYYALYDGKRNVPEKDGHTHIQPCLTNEEVIRITIATVRKHFDEHPQASTYSLCPNDSDKFCECPSCRALDDTMGEYRGRRMNSNSYFHYVNAVAEEVLKTHPDRYLGTYAYWTTELVPHNVSHLPPNVVVYLTQDSSQCFDPEYEARDRQILADWSKVADHLAVYDYYGLSWHTPRYYPGIVARTLPHLPTVNVKGFYCETYPHWANTAPQHYLASRLLWDTSEDPEAILDEWFQRMFREAAPKMKEFYQCLEEGWMSRWKQGRWFLGLTNIYVHMISWRAPYRDRAWRLINEAHKAARGHLIRQRVEYVLNGHRFAYIVSKSCERIEAVGSNPETLGADVREVLALMHEGMDVNNRYVVPDLTYGAAYYRDRRMEDAYDRWKGVAAMKLHEATKDREDVRARLRREDALFSELMDIAVKPDWIEWIDETKKEVPEE